MKLQIHIYTHVNVFVFELIACFVLVFVRYSAAEKVSLTDSDPSQFRDIFNLGDYELKQHQPLRLKKKFYEFYTAPITKFWADSVSINKILGM